jgi:hypothetical protein
MSDTPLTAVDLINHALEGNPTKVGDTFNNLIMPKIVDAVAAKKQEISQVMFDDLADEDEGSDEGSEDTSNEAEEDLEQTEDEATEDENTEADA